MRFGTTAELPGPVSPAEAGLAVAARDRVFELGVIGAFAPSPGVPVAGVPLCDRFAPLLTAIVRARFGSDATRGGTLVAARQTRHRSVGD